MFVKFYSGHYLILLDSLCRRYPSITFIGKLHASCILMFVYLLALIAQTFLFAHIIFFYYYYFSERQRYYFILLFLFVSSLSNY